jgi:hypothetical protein
MRVFLLLCCFYFLALGWVKTDQWSQAPGSKASSSFLPWAKQGNAFWIWWRHSFFLSFVLIQLCYLAFGCVIVICCYASFYNVLLFAFAWFVSLQSLIWSISTGQGKTLAPLLIRTLFKTFFYSIFFFFFVLSHWTLEENNVRFKMNDGHGTRGWLVSNLVMLFLLWSVSNYWIILY